MSNPDVQLAREGVTSRRSKAARSVILSILKQLRGAGLTIQEPGTEPLFFGDESAPLQGVIEVQQPRAYRRVLLGGALQQARVLSMVTGPRRT